MRPDRSPFRAERRETERQIRKTVEPPPPERMRSVRMRPEEDRAAAGRTGCAGWPALPFPGRAMRMRSWTVERRTTDSTSGRRATIRPEEAVGWPTRTASMNRRWKKRANPCWERSPCRPDSKPECGWGPPPLPPPPDEIAAIPALYCSWPCRLENQWKIRSAVVGVPPTTLCHPPRRMKPEASFLCGCSGTQQATRSHTHSHTHARAFYTIQI